MGRPLGGRCMSVCMNMWRCAYHIGDRAWGEPDEAEEVGAARERLVVRDEGAALFEGEAVVVQALDDEGAHQVEEGAKGGRHRDHEGVADRLDGEGGRREVEALLRGLEVNHDRRDDEVLVLGGVVDPVGVGQDVQDDGDHVSIGPGEGGVGELLDIVVVCIVHVHVLEGGHVYQVGR